MFENNDLFGYTNNKYEESKENLRYKAIFDTTDHFEDHDLDHNNDEDINNKNHNDSSDDCDSEIILKNIQ